VSRDGENLHHSRRYSNTWLLLHARATRYERREKNLESKDAVLLLGRLENVSEND
jgi:hypothetical protein